MIERPFALTRHLRGASASLPVTFEGESGDPTDAAGAVTVRVQRSDGTDLLAAGTGTTNTAGTGTYAVALTAAQTATLDVLEATWTDAGDASTTISVHEIVGGYYFSVQTARAFDPRAFAPERYENTRIVDARRQVEDEFEQICATAFVPRFRRARLSGHGGYCLQVPDTMVRSVRSVRVYSSPTSYTTFTAAELAAIPQSRTGLLQRTDGGIWDSGTANLVVEYEHGWDRPPEPVRQAALRRLAQVLGEAKQAVPFNAISYNADSGVTYRLSTPSFARTGDPSIDGVLAKFSFAIPGLA